MVKKQKKQQRKVKPTQEQNVRFSQTVWLALAAILVVLHFAKWIWSPEEVNLTLTSHPGLWRSLVVITTLVSISGVVYVISQQITDRKISLRWWYLIFASVGAYYLLSFNPKIAPNGDNAEYLIVAKSVVERGEVLRLDTPAETKNSLANLGFPILLMPIYKQWGFDIVVMKIFIVLLALIVPFFMIQLFRFYATDDKARLIAVVVFASPYLVGTSSSLMTETPYLFWSILALWLGHEFATRPSKTGLWLILFLLASTMAFLTRAIGVSIFLATTLFLLINFAAKKSNSTSRRMGLLKSHQKFIAFMIPLGLVSIVWLVRQNQMEVSQIDAFFSGDLLQRFSQNIFALSNVYGQMLFSDDTFRWYRLSTTHVLAAKNLLWFLPVGLIAIGLIRGVLQKQLIAFYTLITMALILTGSTTPQERVMIRYISVLVPFFIYYFFIGVDWTCKRLSATINNPNLVPLKKALPYALLLQILLVALSGNRFNALMKSPVYNDYYDSFIKAAQWCGNNLPANSLIMSVKPRLVYILSGLKGTPMAGEKDRYSESWAESMLEKIEVLQVSHLIVDAISITTQENIYPLLENHPHKFEALGVPGLNQQCTIVKVK